MKPKGTLIAIGGNEELPSRIDEKDHGSILKNFILHAGGLGSRIEVMTCATDFPEEVGDDYKDAFRHLGAENVGSLIILDRKSADNPSILKRLEQANAILFSGGDQVQITDFLKDTKTHELLFRKFLDENFVIAGTSAGAVALAEQMITGGKSESVLKKNNLMIKKGLGFSKRTIFESHYFERGRLGRLAEAIAMFPDLLGIGLGEDTGVIMKEGNKCEVIGTGMVMILDGSEFDHNYYHELDHNEPVSLVNLKVHMLSPKDKYFINEKEAKIYNNKRASPEVSM